MLGGDGNPLHTQEVVTQPLRETKVFKFCEDGALQGNSGCTGVSTHTLTMDGAEMASLREGEQRERSAARARQIFAEEEENRRLVEDRRPVDRCGGSIYMTQMEAAEHVAERTSLLQRWRDGDEWAGEQLTTQERMRERHTHVVGKRQNMQRVQSNMQRKEEKRLARMMQGMPSIFEQQQQHQHQYQPYQDQHQHQHQYQHQHQLHLQMGQQYICFVKRSGFGAPVSVLGVSKRGALLTAHGGSCMPSDEGRSWVFCDAFGNAIDGHAPGQHVNLEELSGASFVTQECTANVDVNDGTASEAPSDSSFFTARWLPHDLV